jgi:GDP-L-fucose synthase
LAAQGDWNGIQTDADIFGAIPDSVMANLTAISVFNGHAIPSFLQDNNRPDIPPAVMLWGSGRPRREFVHVDDMADACVFLMNLDDPAFFRLCLGEEIGGFPMINIGCGQDQTVRELAEIVAAAVSYPGDVKWDETQPDGMPRKLMDVSRLNNLGWQPGISLAEGIRRTYTSYQQTKKGAG